MNDDDLCQQKQLNIYYEQNRILNQKLTEQYMSKFFNEYQKDFQGNLSFCEFVILFQILQDSNLLVGLKSLIYQYVKTGRYDQNRFQQIINYLRSNKDNLPSARYLISKSHLPSIYQNYLFEQEKNMYDMNCKNQKVFFDIHESDFSATIINKPIIPQQYMTSQNNNLHRELNDINCKNNFLELINQHNQYANFKKTTFAEVRRQYQDQHMQFARGQFSIKKQLNYITNYQQEMKQYKQDSSLKQELLSQLSQAYQRLKTKNLDKFVLLNNKAALIFLITFIEKCKMMTPFQIVQLLTFQDKINPTKFVNNICFSPSQEIKNIDQFRATAVYSYYVYDINIYIEFSDSFTLSQIQDRDWDLLLANILYRNFFINANQGFIVLKEVDSGKIYASHNVEEVLSKVNYRLQYDVIIVSDEPCYTIQQLRMRTLRYQNSNTRQIRITLRYHNDLQMLYLGGVKCSNMNQLINLRGLGSLFNEYTQNDIGSLKNLKFFSSNEDVYISRGETMLETLMLKSQLISVSIQGGMRIAADSVLYTGLHDLRVFYIGFQANIILDQTMQEAEDLKVAYIYDEEEDMLKIPTLISKRLKKHTEQQHQLLSY